MDMEQLIRSSIQDSIQVKQRLLSDPALTAMIQRTAEAAIAVLKRGGKVLLCGNGGSAADAQHLAGEFVSHLRFDHPPLPAVALNCNTSILTAIGNDYAYRQIFQRQVEALGRPGDMLWAFSTTGHSENIRLAMETARTLGISTVGFLGGSGGDCLAAADYPLLVPSDDTPRVQECHIMMGHILCDCIEQTLFVRP